jgi:hypothetical protein
MKKLEEMTLTELWELFPIILKDHNVDYEKWYGEEKQQFHIIPIRKFQQYIYDRLSNQAFD